MIPAVMTVQPRNYMPARYIIKGDVRPLSDKFDFLPREGEVMIMRNLDGNKFLDDYIVSCRGYYGKDTEKSGRMEVLSQADREKLELGLIAHPNVKYLADYREIPESNPYL